MGSTRTRSAQVVTRDALTQSLSRGERGKRAAMLRAVRRILMSVLLGAIGIACGGPEKASVERVATPPASRAVEAEDVASRTKRAAGTQRPVLWLGVGGRDLRSPARLAAGGG